MERVAMTQCIFCGAETQLFDNGKPVCLKCDSKKNQQTFGKRPEMSTDEGNISEKPASNAQ
jgi:hypothetical protein